MNRRGFGRDAAAILTSQAVIAFVQIGIAVVTARALGADGRGYYALAVLFGSMLIAFSDLGLGPAGPRFAAAGTVSRRKLLGTYASAGIARVLILLAIGMYLVSSHRDALFPGVPESVLHLGLLQVVPTTVAGFVLPLLTGFGAAVMYSRLQVISSALTLSILGSWWALAGLGVHEALLLQLGCGIVMAIVIWQSVYRLAGGVEPPDLRFLWRALKYSTGIFVSSLTAFANARLIWLLINAMSGVAAVGIFTIAQTATERIYLLSDALGTVLLPKVAENPDRNSKAVTPIVFRIALVIGIVLATGLAVIAEPLVRFLFSDQFIDAVPVLRVLLIGAVLQSGWRILYQDLNARGHTATTATVNIAVTVLGLTLAFFLIDGFGLKGAAYAQICAAGLALVLGVGLYAKYTGGYGAVLTLIIPTDRELTILFGLVRRKRERKDD